MSPITALTAIYSLGIAAGRFLPVELLFICLLIVALIFMTSFLAASGKEFKALLILIVFLGGIAAFQHSSLSSPKFHFRRAEPNPVIRLATAIKDKLIAGEQRTMEEPFASLLGSIIFGSAASPIPDELQDKYRVAGVIHLLVVSGTQVSIIMSVFLGTFKSLGFSRPLTFLFSTLANALFTIMVGAGPSIVRAAVMSEAALFAATFGRDNDFYNSLSLSALALLIFDPLTLFNIGFQLSFVATWALFYLAPIIEEKLSSRMPEYLSRAISVSTAPTIATTALTFYDFAQVSFVAVFTNFLIVPWVEVTVVLGFASTVIGLFLEPVAYVINNTLTLMLMMLNSIIFFFSGLPFACRYFAPPHFIFILLYYAVLIWGAEKLRKNEKFRFNRALIACVIIVIALSSFFGHAFADKNKLTVSVIDVGQGDSILIESPAGRTMLIDGGDTKNKAGRFKVLPYLHSRGVNSLDIVMLTHPHDDHVGGLVDVLNNMKVSLVLDSGQPHTSPAYLKFLKLVQKKKVPYKLGRAGQVIDLGGGVSAHVLWPADKLLTGTQSDLNENSIVIKLEYGKTSFLLVGDLGAEGEGKLLKMGKGLKSDVLKVGHHGSKYSSTQKFLELVSPRYAGISVGAGNTFGHPNDKTLYKLEMLGSGVLRTDKLGDIVFTSDGENIQVKHR